VTTQKKKKEKKKKKVNMYRIRGHTGVHEKRVIGNHLFEMVTNWKYVMPSDLLCRAKLVLSRGEGTYRNIAYVTSDMLVFNS